MTSREAPSTNQSFKILEEGFFVFKKGQVLLTDADFYNAKLFAIPVEVWQQGELLDYGNPIERLIEGAAFVKDGYYHRELCEFKIA